jgi:CheY-like chemotaxis protein
MPELSKILIVDDEDDIRTVASMALEFGGGFTVEQASNGQQALNDIPVFKPDIILLDVMMPGMDGPEVFRRMKLDDFAKGIPVIFMTAKVQPHEVQGYMNLGAVAVIPKPFEAMMLASQVTRIWNESKN